jgi:hypothetical protein
VDAVNGPVQRYWNEQTGGLVKVATAAVNFGWGISAYDCSNPTGLWNAAATRANWTGGPGKHLLVNLPQNSAGCSYGLAQIGGSMGAGGKLYVTDVATSVMAHELGHNFGLGTRVGASATRARRPVPAAMWTIATTTTSWASPWVGQLNAPQAARLGVLPAGQQVAVTTAPAAFTPCRPTAGTRGSERSS